MEKLRQIWNMIKDKIKIGDIDEMSAQIEFAARAGDIETMAQTGNKLNKALKRKKEIEYIDCLFADYEIFEEFNAASDMESVEEELRPLVAEMRTRVMLNGEFDENNAILTLHAGEGGTEACDWVKMMARMYIRWAERKGFDVEIIDRLDGEVAGIKSISLEVKGDYAFGYLRSEAGTHRLVRISPFDSQGRRHTSFCAVEVVPELENINPEIVKLSDCDIQTFRSGGPGGQHQNKTESGVRLIHKPTGLVAECREERSQMQNREKALSMLQGKVIAAALEERQKQAAEFKNAEVAGWGNSIRSYVFMPYQLVKDNRTGYETGKIDSVMDGDLDGFIEAFLIGE